MIPKALTAVTALAITLVSLPLQAADSPTKAIPGDASIVIRFSKPEATLDKVAVIAQKFHPGAGFAIAIAKAGLGALISNQDQAGVDKTKDWWVAVYPKAEGEPGVLFAVAGTDLAAMKAALPEGFTTAESENWLLYSNDPALTKKVGGQNGLATSIPKSAASVLNSGDLAAFVNLASLKTVYKTQIQDAREQVDQTLEQLENFAPPTQQGINMSGIFKMYGSMVGGVFQGLDDSTAFAISLGIEKDALTIEDVLNVSEGSATAKFFDTHKPSEIARLGKLPDGQIAYAGFHGDTQALAKFGMEFYKMMIEDPATKTKLDTAMKDMAAVQYGAYVMSMALGDLESGAIRGTVMAEVAKGTDLKTLSRKLYDSMSGISLPGVKQTITVEKDIEKYGDRTADVVTVDQQVDPQFDPLGIQKQMMQAFYGPDGMKSRVVYLDDAMVQTVGGGRASMEKALAELGKTPNPQSPQNALRAQLLPQANVVIMFDLATLVKDVAKLVLDAEVIPIPIDGAPLGNLKFESSYIGISAGTETNGVRAKTVIPMKQIKNLFDLGMTMKGMAPGPQL
ncbi:MAG: hypothetical protein O3A00_13395 [Planctomycetota bacterium]|nr:hypothetical protein [Planctomycetota bacterium]